MLHGHGDDGYRYPGPLRANFSSNVRPGGVPPALRRHLSEQLDRAGTYPEVAAESLTALLAAQHRVAPDEVLVTNGAVAAIYLVAQAWRGAHAAIVVPTFSEYADAARIAQQTLTFLTRDDFALGRFGAATLVWLCNPNNPTGEVFSRDQLLDTIDRHPAVTFVVDQAYAAFCAEAPLTASDATTRPNLVLLHSLTKEFGLPGLRLGYLVTARPTRARLARASAPWTVNALALTAGEFCARHPTEVALPVAELLRETSQLQIAIAAAPGLRPRSTATAFFLVELACGTARHLKEWLVREHRLLVRDAGNFHGLAVPAVRVATQTPEENRWLEEALHTWRPW